jgi:cyclase
MIPTRVIPCLLLRDAGLIKTVEFQDPKYVGDPRNAVKIFNEKEIDEIVILDIDASRENRGPNFEQIAELAGEAFIPLAYGGGITDLEQIKKLFYLGVEKVILNQSAFSQPTLISDAAKRVGSQSIVASIDYKKNIFGKATVYISNGTTSTKEKVLDYARKMVDYGAGELILNSIERDGTYNGYDQEMIEMVSKAISVPVVAVGGASKVEDFRLAVEAGASAVAAGSMFVYQRPHNAVLINYPNQAILKQEIFDKI